MDSILISVKKMLGIESDYANFDPELIMHINSVLMALTQLGIGQEQGYVISDSTDTWIDFVGNAANLEAIKSYVYLKVRLLFDPPASSSVLDSFNRQASEFEWRLNINAEKEN